MQFRLHDPQLGFLLGLFIGHTRSNEEVLVIDAAVGEGHEADVHEPNAGPHLVLQRALRAAGVDLHHIAEALQTLHLQTALELLVQLVQC